MNACVEVTGGDRFECCVAATADQLVAARAAFSAWLGELIPPVAKIRGNDIVLACYEAMANAVEHGYLNRGDGDGDVILDAAYDQGHLTVTVTDSGAWKAPTGEDSFRGRGLPLIEMLSDHNRVKRGSSGTEVAMTWYAANTEPP